LSGGSAAPVVGSKPLGQSLQPTRHVADTVSQPCCARRGDAGCSLSQPLDTFAEGEATARPVVRSLSGLIGSLVVACVTTPARAVAGDSETRGERVAVGLILNRRVGLVGGVGKVAPYCWSGRRVGHVGRRSLCRVAASLVSKMIS
jgi:hypothetical protein